MTENAQCLKQRIESKEATIGVVGLGYVGLPLALECAINGFDTIGIDVDRKRVDMINEGKNYIKDVSDDDLRNLVSEGRLRAVNDLDHSKDADIYYLCVPTPVTAQKVPDTSYIQEVTSGLAKYMRSGKLYILKSTTYPMTTEGLVLPILQASADKLGLMIGEDYFLAFSPERIDPGNKEYTTANTPVVVGGVTSTCTELASLAMAQIVPGGVHQVSSPQVAEMEKLLENVFRSVNIALVNEIALLCDRIGDISVWEVIEAAATKPFGFMPFSPGPGIGGHCIPIDPYYLSWLARGYDFETSFITLAARINDEMPYYVRDAVTSAVSKLPVSQKDANILSLGVAFKKNVDDIRHSPSIRIMELLLDAGFDNLAYCDPLVDTITLNTVNGPVIMNSSEISEELLKEQEVVLVLTEHEAFPYDQICANSRLVLDTRNAMSNCRQKMGHVRLLGSGSF